MVTFRGDELVEYEKRTLQLREYAAIANLGSTARGTLEFETQEDFMTKQLFERVSMSILSDKIAEDKYVQDYSYSVFANPWQHFKHLYMPEWFKKRFPVRKEQKNGKVTVKFTRFAEYPKANVAMRNDTYTFVTLLGGHERIYDEVTAYNEQPKDD